MTKLTDEQHDQLAIISNLYGKRRTVRADVLKELDVLIASRTERINADLHEAVRKSVDSGTPARRIGMAIGTSANRTWTELINESFANPVPDAEIQEAVPEEVTASNVVIENIGDSRWVHLSDYPLDGDVVSGDVEFTWDATEEEWLVQGDTSLDFAVERAIFANGGSEPTLSNAFYEVKS